MTEYRRHPVPGASWFFTVNLAERRNNRLLTDKIDLLREAFEYTKSRHPFRMNAFVILPDHLHCIWTLPTDDDNFSMRWRVLKGYFSRQIQTRERISASRKSRRERGIWQRRFWEHLLRDQADFNRHADYIHWNPVKHGWVRQVYDWPYSSFHHYVEQGIYPKNWGLGDCGGIPLKVSNSGNNARNSSVVNAQEQTRRNRNRPECSAG